MLLSALSGCNVYKCFNWYSHAPHSGREGCTCFNWLAYEKIGFLYKHHCIAGGPSALWLAHMCQSTRIAAKSCLHIWRSHPDTSSGCRHVCASLLEAALASRSPSVSKPMIQLILYLICPSANLLTQASFKECDGCCTDMMLTMNIRYKASLAGSIVFSFPFTNRTYGWKCSGIGLPLAPCCTHRPGLHMRILLLMPSISPALRCEPVNQQNMLGIRPALFISPWHVEG